MTVIHPRQPEYILGRSAAGPAAEALVRARDHLLALQDDQGWWQGELETNVTMDAKTCCSGSSSVSGPRSRRTPRPGG